MMAGAMATLDRIDSPALDRWGDLSAARAALARGADRVALEGLWGSASALALAASSRSRAPAARLDASGDGCPASTTSMPPHCSPGASP